MLQVRSPGVRLPSWLVFFGLSWVVLGFISGCGSNPGYEHATDYRLIPPITASGAVNVVVEIPAGTTAKYEMDKSSGTLEHERLDDGSLRYVDYLGYPGNYGFVPGTLLPSEEGGDGDPLDVVVLGPAAERGVLLRTRVIGVLRLKDGGEADDKLVAVELDGPLGDVESMDDLDRRYPGVSRILETWFVNYKGPGELKSGGFGTTEEANQILKQAVGHAGGQAVE